MYLFYEVDNTSIKFAVGHFAVQLSWLCLESILCQTLSILDDVHHTVRVEYGINYAQRALGKFGMMEHN